MAFRTRYRRKMPSSPEVQGLFFDKAQVAPAFFNPSHQTGDRSNSTATSVVQRQEGAPPKPEEEKPMQKQAKQEEPPVQKQAKEEEAPVQRQAKEEEKPVQKQAKEEEEPMQKQAKEEEKPVQKQTKEEEKPVQKQGDSTEKKPPKPRVTIHPSHSDGEQEQITGLPDRLKAGIEALSGITMDDVEVHYNSPKPAQMKALAYTQGSDIYIGPGQERHLPHEAWHVVQQKKGRVEPTMQTKGVGVNDNPGLEREATVMGQKANDHSSLA
jgi:outer membrane biosynthesis protein TonB